ncbi:MAG: vitamin B12 dependent-methionine synthase activation domain-containing protein [Lachnospiraceae bacterium]|nr:vitamin B12 dependent-methionine synthase activation domain-containing protein [Lachnospiraceae bacterium]
MRVDRKEIFRYLGYKGAQVDEVSGALVESCLAELGQAAEPRHVIREFPLRLGSGEALSQREAQEKEPAQMGMQAKVFAQADMKEKEPAQVDMRWEIDGGCFHTSSRNLSRNLKDCERILVFAATLGLGADHLIQKYSRIQMSRAVVLQAAAAAMIEEYCDTVCSEIREEYESRGWYLRPRFSPGYGDFPLSCQPQLLDGLEAGKRIGIKLTDSCLMMPSKSVTAVMGVSRKPYRCEVKGCEACGKTDCAYRRET